MLKKSMIAGGTIDFSSSFFNPQPSRWEPIIEKYGFDYDIIMSDSSPKMSISLGTAEKYDDFNINISDQMLELIYYTIKTWSTDFETKKYTSTKKVLSKDEEAIEYVTPYTIVNELGYPIIIEPDLTNKIVIKSVIPKLIKIDVGERKNYRVESDTDKVWAHGIEDIASTNKVLVKINHPKYTFPMINNVDVDKVRTISCAIDAKDKDGKTILSNQAVFCELKVEKTKKVMVLSSSVLIQNNTDTKVQAVVEYGSQQFNIMLDQHESHGVPLDFLLGTISFKIFDQGSDYSSKKSITECLKSPSAIDIKCGIHYITLKATQKEPKLALYTINIEAPFVIKNCCALPIYYQLNAAGIKETKMTTLKTQEIHQETLVPRITNVAIKARMQNYGWSKDFIIHSPETTLISNQITLIDVTGKPLYIHIYVKNLPTGGKIFYLYTKVCIINETPYDLFIYTNERDKKPVLAAGQKVLNPDEPINKKICLTNEAIGLGLSRIESKDGKEISKTVAIGAVGSTAAEMESSNGTMMEFGVNIYAYACDKELYIYTKTITISPRYVILNKTQHVLLAKREGTEKGEIELLPEVRTPFQWFDWKGHAK